MQHWLAKFDDAIACRQIGSWSRCRPWRKWPRHPRPAKAPDRRSSCHATGTNRCRQTKRWHRWVACASWLNLPGRHDGRLGTRRIMHVPLAVRLHRRVLKTRDAVDDGFLERRFWGRARFGLRFGWHNPRWQGPGRLVMVFGFSCVVLVAVFSLRVWEIWSTWHWTSPISPRFREMPCRKPRRPRSENRRRRPVCRRCSREWRRRLQDKYWRTPR